MVTVQTNMLAVNGNVEAAGPAITGGLLRRGGDIRSLSNESSENADRIKDLVRQVQAQIQRVASDIELAGKTAVAEVSKAKVVTANLDEDRGGGREGASRHPRGGNGSAGIAESPRASGQGVRGDQFRGAGNQSRDRGGVLPPAEEASKAAQEIAQAVEEIASQADELQHG